MTTKTPETRWLTVNEVARYLSLHPRTVRRMIARGELPAVRVGAVEIRIATQELDAYLRSRPVTGSVPARIGRAGSN